MNVFSQPAMQIQQGSLFSVALVLRRGDGTFVDLTGRSFVFRIYGRTETHDLEATIVDSNKAVALVDEALTTDLPTNRALQYSWLMRIGDGGTAFSPAWVQGAVAVYDVGGGLSGQATIPNGGEIVFGVEVDGASVVSVTSNGLPGLSPWEAEGQTYSEWFAGTISNPVSAATQAANGAAAFAQAQGDYAKAQGDAAAGIVADADTIVASVPLAEAARDAAEAFADSIDDRIVFRDSLDDTYATMFTNDDGYIIGGITPAGKWDIELLNPGAPGAVFYDTLDLDGPDVLFVNNDGYILDPAAAEPDAPVVADVLPNQGERYLYRTRTQISRILNGDAGAQWIVAWLGDSLTDFAVTYYLKRLFDRMAALGLPKAAPGWFGFGKGRGVDPGATMNPGSWVATTTGGGKGPDSNFITGTSASGPLMINAIPAGLSGVRLFHEGGGAQIAYTWNGGAATALTLAAGSAETIVPLAGFAGGGSLAITVTSGTAVLNGLTFDSTARGMVWHDLADSSSTAAQQVAIPQADWIIGMSALAPHLIVIPYMTNDRGAYPAATFKAHIQTLIDRARLAAPTADILLVAFAENNAAPARAMADYQTAVLDLATANKCAALNLQYYFGDVVADYVFGGPRARFDNTLVHFNDDGGADATIAFERLFMGNR